MHFHCRLKDQISTKTRVFIQGFHSKPIGVLNVNGFFDHLLAFMDHATQEGFIRQTSRDIVVDGKDPAELIDKLLSYQGKTILHYFRYNKRLFDG